MSCVVVKLGGHALDSLDPESLILRQLAEDVTDLRSRGTDVAIVHGGGPQIAELLERLGMAGRFHEGLRVTDPASMKVVAMALMLVNVRITAALNQSGLATVGLAGSDASLFRASSIGEPWDRVGGAPRVCPQSVTSLWAAGLTPVVSPLALDERGDLLNCNADTAAGALAGALDAEWLVLLSDVDQLLGDADDTSSALISVTSAQVRDLIARGAVREGMRPKMMAAIDALEGGAKRVLMANGTRTHSLQCALNGQIPTTEVLE